MEANEFSLEFAGSNIVGVGSLQQGFPAMKIAPIKVG
jgi:hypothetical protein